MKKFLPNEELELSSLIPLDRLVEEGVVTWVPEKLNNKGVYALIAQIRANYHYSANNPKNSYNEKVKKLTSA